MSHAALDRLIAREAALVTALDGGDVAALEQASEGLRATLMEVAACGGWRADAALRARVEQALAHAEAAGARINYLADRTRRQLDRLAALTGAPRAQAYGRHGRLR